MDEEQRYLSARQVSRWLGLHINTIYDYVRRRSLPCYRLPSGKLVFDRYQVIKWMRRSEEEFEEERG